MLGAPASGKGTQAARLASHFELPKLSTGAFIRAEQQRGTTLGQLADRHLASGGFLPDELMLDVMGRWLDADGAAGFVLDGFPRTLPQAEVFDGILAASEHQLDAIVLLETDAETLRQRCAGRLHCGLCGETFQLGSAGVEAAGQCPQDVCNGTLAPREDDEPATYAERLAKYHSLTEPLIEHYERCSTLIRVDGSGSPEVVFGEILDQLGATAATTETH